MRLEIVIEPDGDVWAASCPSLLKQGASTWGRTKEEAFANISQVLKIVEDSLRDHGEQVPEEAAAGDVQIPTSSRATAASIQPAWRSLRGMARGSGARDYIEQEHRREIEHDEAPDPTA